MMSTMIGLLYALFPPSKDGGSIEAAQTPIRRDINGGFPPSKDGGSIEAEHAGPITAVG